MAEKKKEKKESAEKKDAEKKISKKLKERENKQLVWFFIIVGVVFAGFLGSYFYFQSLKTFDFAGIKFEKVKDFDIDFYHGRFPIVYQGVVRNYYNFFLRNDPRENDVPINTNFSFRTKIVLSLEPEAGNCPDAGLAHIELSKFFGAIGTSILGDRFEIEGAFTDEAIANATNLTYATCEHVTNRQGVIITQKSDFPSIEKPTDGCYILNVGNCENLKVAERFITGIIAQVNGAEI